MPARRLAQSQGAPTIHRDSFPTQRESTSHPTLSMMSRRDPDTWKKLKERLEKFGSDSGLFDEISIESFGRTDDATPFQIQIRKFGGKLKGNRRNLIDVGYGVSQALPIITELLRPDASSMFLLQQPEVHLHPSAQAALGSLFCSIAGPTGSWWWRRTATTSSTVFAWTSGTRRPISSLKTSRFSTSSAASRT